MLFLAFFYAFFSFSPHFPPFFLASALKKCKIPLAADGGKKRSPFFF
jgi:hypothetical protein